MAPPRSLLGEGFSIGVATSGYRVEGGFNGAGEPHNNWTGWELSGRVPRPAGWEFWRNPTRALDWAATLGCNAFGLSVEWARLEPRPGELDDAALGRYAGILAACTTAGLEPVVTLHHFTHPWWLGEEFWLRPGSPDVFARHVSRIAPALAPHCRRWVTIHEPNVVSLMGWITGAHPPGRRMALSDAACALDNLLTAHVLAADALTTVQPEAEVIVRTSPSSVYEHDRMLIDLLRLRELDVEPADVDRFVDERRVVHDAAYPPRHAGEAALRRFFAAGACYGATREPGRGRSWARLRDRMRRSAPRRVVDAVRGSTRPRSLDAVGLDWCDPLVSHAVALPGRRGSDGRRDWSLGRVPTAPPAGRAALGSWCATESALRPGLPLWVSGGAEPVEDLLAVAQAAADGVPVRALLPLVEHSWDDETAGAFTRVLAALRAGDGSVLEPTTRRAP